MMRELNFERVVGFIPQAKAFRYLQGKKVI